MWGLVDADEAAVAISLKFKQNAQTQERGLQLDFLEPSYFESSNFTSSHLEGV